MKMTQKFQSSSLQAAVQTFGVAFLNIQTQFPFGVKLTKTSRSNTHPGDFSPVGSNLIGESHF